MFQGAGRGAFSGYVDEPRVWKRALSETEIQSNMNRAIPYHPDLLGRWGMDDGAGYVAVNSAQDDWHGRIVLTEWEKVDLPPALGLGTCASPALPGCCQVSDDCDDSNACTTDSCVGFECQNLYAPAAGCCAWGAQCDDGNPCTDAVCDETGSCSNPPLDSDDDSDLDCVDSDDDDDGLDDVCDNCSKIGRAHV